MKKLFSLILTVVFALLMVILASAEGEKTVNAIKGTPVIDGVVDEIWANANEVLVNVLNEGKASVTGKAKMMWDADYFYTLIFVNDKTISAKHKDYIWERDSVEFYIDEDNAKASAYDTNDAQCIVDINNQARGINILTDILKTGVKISGEGYYVEIAIPFREITGKHGLKIGYDIGINDDPGTGLRQGVTGWNQEDSDAYANPAAFGTITLVTDNKTPVESKADTKSNTESKAESNVTNNSKKKIDNSTWYVVGGAGVVIIMVAGVLIFKRKK